MNIRYSLIKRLFLQQKFELLYVMTNLDSILKSRDITLSFRRVGLLFWVPDVLCRHSEVVLWNLLDV